MHEVMRLEEKNNRICTIKDKLIEKIEEESSKPTQEINTEELGEVVDMVKDLAEIEEKCWKSCYYKTVITGMKEASMDEHNSYGYNNNRYASGRYAPSGHGDSTKGYMPPVEPDNSMYYHMMGYSGEPSNSRRQGYDEDYNRYPYSNMNGYYPSGSGNRSQSGNKMGYDGENLMDSLEIMYTQANPEQKKRIKEEIHKISEKM